MSADSIRVLARSLCDTSSHINLLPHDEQRPCQYHLDRARAVLADLQRKRWDLGVKLEGTTRSLVVDRDAEISRLQAEDLRRRVPPVRAP